MFQIEWRDRGAWRNLPGRGISAERSRDRQIIESSTLIWMEHCVECAAPLCYASCGLYEDRGDGDCRRFAYGIYPNKSFSGLYNYGADIYFKRWAKLEAMWPKEPKILPVRRIRLLAGVLKLHDLMHWVAIKLLPANTLTFKRAKKYLWLGKKWSIEKLSRSARGKEKPDAFYVKLYSPEQRVCNLQLELIQDVPVYRTNLEVVPGWNEYTLPFKYFDFPAGKERLIRLWVDRDQEVRLIFTWLELVRFKPLHRKDSAAPADKVKCVAWDLDNTLWKGVIGDDGAEGVEVIPEAVNVIKKLDQRGIVQTIASKNERETAWVKLVEIGLDQYFLYPAINWDPKSVNLMRIADELNININTFALIDDSDFERGEVSAALPQMRVYDEKEVTSLLSYKEFDVPVSKDTARRRLSYIEEIKRKNVNQDWKGDLDSFLRDCAIELSIRPVQSQGQIDRCLELLHRTNQFNLSGKRYTDEEFDELLASDESNNYTLDVKDRYGDYGIVGFVSVENRNDAIMVNDFVMSCRVARKKIENAFFHWYLSKKECEGKNIYALMKATGKNQPLRRVFEELMFEIVEDTPDGALMCVESARILSTTPPILIGSE